ncbi:K Homology domain,K Homology domain, type 1, partial [Cinara cedri]
AFTVSILGKKFDSGKVVNVANAKSFCKKIIIDTGVHIEISTTKTKADMTFIVSGKQTNVEEAKKRIVSSIQTQLDVPVKYRRPLIGLNGETVRKLCSTHKVRIVIPPKEEYKNIIKITGPQQNLEQVVKEIKALMEDFDNKQLRARLIQTANDHKKISRKENPADKKTIGEVQCMQEHTSDTSSGTIIPMSSQIEDEHIVGKAYNQELQVKLDSYASKLKKPKIDHQRQQPPSIIPPKTDVQISNDHKINAHETKSDENQTCVGDSQGLQENPMDIS